MDEGDEKYKRYANIPIPTYDEATSFRSSSSLQQRGPEEISDDAERQGLLHQGDGAYRQPAVESARSSVDSDLRLPEVDGEEYDRRQVEELDYLDPAAPDTSRRSPRLYHRARLRNKFTQRLSDLSATLSSIRIPSFRSLYTSVPNGDHSETPAPTTLSYLTRLAQRIHIPDQYRMSGPTAARLCGLLTIGLLVYVLFAMDVFPTGPGGRLGNGQVHFDPESVRQFVQDEALRSGDAMKNYLQHITSFDHVAGTEGDLYLAKWVEGLFRGGVDGEGSFGPETVGAFDEVAILPYYVYMNYPTAGGRGVEIVEPSTMHWTADLNEAQAVPNQQQTLAWHGHSKSGNAQGHLIFANEGRQEDFNHLQDKGIVTNGSIALVKSLAGSSADVYSLALQIKAAEDAGCEGVLVYLDPASNSPDSAWKPPNDSLQRGSTSRSNIILGDPLTPGFASILDVRRKDEDGNPALPQIPSLPLSWRDAQHLITILMDNKLGVHVPQTWGGGAVNQDDVEEWWSGNLTSTSGSDNVPIVYIKNENDENEVQQIWNVHGQLIGLESPGKKIMVGSHRDSFCFGSVNPGSGTAVMLEVINIFAELRKLGWQPLRTLEFVSWDAGEWANMGATEYVEDNVSILRQATVAYLNVDAAVWGPDQTLQARGSPVWQRSLLHVLDRVSDPNANASLKQLWEQHSSVLKEPPTVDSDTLPFQSLAGASSLDIGFSGAAEDRYPRGSCYENFDWMASYGDPSFTYHKALAQVWALLILEMVDRPLLPYDLHAYAERLKESLSIVERFVAGTYAELNSLPIASVADVYANTNFTLQPLKDAVDVVSANAKAFHEFEDVWTSNVFGSGGLETTQFRMKRLQYNDRLANFETDLLDLSPIEGCSDGGMPGRCQYKHVIYGPTASGVQQLFPGVVDAVEAGNWELAIEMVERAAERIQVASQGLMD